MWVFYEILFNILLDRALLEDMLQTTAPTHPDNKPLQEAVQVFKELSEYLSACSLDVPCVMRLCEIQASFVGFPGKLSDNFKRKLLHDGELTVDGKKKRHAWLFSDLLVVTELASKEKTYKHILTLNLQTSQLQEASGNKFRVVSPSAVAKFRAPSDHDKFCWCQMIKNALKQSRDMMLSTAFSVEVDFQFFFPHSPVIFIWKTLCFKLYTNFSQTRLSSEDWQNQSSLAQLQPSNCSRNFVEKSTMAKLPPPACERNQEIRHEYPVTK